MFLCDPVRCGKRELTALQAAFHRVSTTAFCFADSAWYLALPWTNCFVRLQRLPAVTLTVMVVEPEPELPARSRAVAVNVREPTPKLYAGPLMFAQVDDAMPDSASVALHVMLTFWSTVYVPALPLYVTT